MKHIRHQHQGTFLVEGKVSSTFTLADGRHVNGRDFLEGEWAWRHHPWEPRARYVRLQAKSPTYRAVTVVIVDEPGQDRFYLLCLETTLSGPVLIRRWRRRRWIAFVFRALKHLLATESCQVHSEDAYYGHFATSDGEFRVVLHVARHLQRPLDDGGDDLQPEALLAFRGYGTLGITSTFIGREWESRMVTG